MNTRYLKRTLPRRISRTIFALTLATMVAWTTGANLYSQSHQAEVLAPPAAGLIPVNLPDTGDLEPEVREQLVTAVKALTAATNDPATPALKLANAYGTVGELYQAYSLNSPAIECYANATRLVPSDFRWAYLLGKLYELEGNVQKAISHYKIALRLSSDYPPVFVNLGNIYLQLNSLDDAEQYFNRALEIDRGSGAAQYGLGQAALSKRNYSSAVAYLENALKLSPEATRLHYALAMAYRGVGQLEKAQDHLARTGSVGVRASDPLVDRLQDLVKGARLHLIRGRAALEVRRYADAVREFRKAIAEQPSSVPAHLNLGAALSQTGDVTGAVAEFEETLRLDPQHLNAHYNLGLLLAQANRHPEAIAHLRSTIAGSPNDNNARFLLAQELALVGRFDEADAEFAKVVQLDPNNEEALLNRVKVLLAQKQYRQALSILENGHTQFPKKQLTTTTLAYLLAASPQVGLRDGKRALELAGTVYEATAAIDHGEVVAMALAELGRCDEAAALLRGLIAKRSDTSDTEMVEKLKAELSRYETARPCRPRGDSIISDVGPRP